MISMFFSFNLLEILKNNERFKMDNKKVLISIVSGVLSSIAAIQVVKKVKEKKNDVEVIEGP